MYGHIMYEYEESCRYPITTTLYNLIERYRAKEGSNPEYILCGQKFYDEALFEFRKSDPYNFKDFQNGSDILTFEGIEIYINPERQDFYCEAVKPSVKYPEIYWDSKPKPEYEG